MSRWCDQSIPDERNTAFPGVSRGDLDEKAATIRMGIRRRGGGMMLGA